MPLECPDPRCGKVCYDLGEESAVAELIYHLDRDHEDLYGALKRKLGGGSE